MISAVGQLNRPKLPDIAGLETVRGRRHALGAVGRRHRPRRQAGGGDRHRRQRVPDRAHDRRRGRAAHRVPALGAVDVPEPALPRRGRRRACSGRSEHLPYYGRWYRFLLFWPACDGGLPAMRIDPDWPHQDRAISEINDAAREVFTQWMADQVGDDAGAAGQGRARLRVPRQAHAAGQRQLARRAHPRQRRAGRPTRSPRSTPTGVVVRRAATIHEVDVIVYATGFHANRYLWPMEIVGRDGVVLGEQWGDDPTAYLGITVPELPEPVLPLRARHQPGARRQPDLPLRVPGPLRDGLPRPRSLEPSHARRSSAARTCTTTTTSGSRPSSTRWCGRTRRSGHSWYRNDEGAHLHPLAVAPGRLLGLDPRARSRGLRAH